MQGKEFNCINNTLKSPSLFFRELHISYLINSKSVSMKYDPKWSLLGKDDIRQKFLFNTYQVSDSDFNLTS